MVHGRHSIGRNQYMVFDLSTSRLSADDHRSSVLGHHCLGLVLRYVDFDSMLFVSLVPGHLLQHVGGTGTRNQCVLSYRNDLHPGPHCVVCVELEMDVRFVYPHYQAMDRYGTQNGGGSAKWIVNEGKRVTPTDRCTKISEKDFRSVKKYGKNKL